MKLKLTSVFTSILFLFISVNISIAATPDSTEIINAGGKKFLIHKVEPKEGWMSIARRYNLPMELVKQANPGIEDLKIGQLVNIPVLNSKIVNPVEKAPLKQPAEIPIPKEEISTLPVIEKTEANAGDEKYKTALKHTVKTGETLFSVSKKFNVSMNDIRAWNNMNDNNIRLGQELIVGYVFRYNSGKNEPVEINENEIYASAGEVQKSRKELRKERRDAKNKEKESEEIKEATENEKTEHSPEANASVPNPLTTINKEEITVENTVAKSTIESGRKATAMTEKGVASWIDDNDINPSKYYALHRTAPAGTIIKVTNRMNNKYVFVKVVGVLPDTGDNTNITIKLSKAAAMKLDVIDARFQAELSYNIYE